MFLHNSQLVIEIILMVVLIIGIVSSRLIVRRLGVIRESYTALNEMVSTLDSSTEQVNHMFERVRHEVSQGDKRLSALLERARNAEEDLLDQKKMAQESSESLTAVLKEADEREAALRARLETSQALLNSLEEQRAIQQEALEKAKTAQEALSNVVDAARSAREADEAARQGADQREDVRQEELQDSAETAAGGQEEAPHFSDTLSMPVPGRLRRPRPYLRNKAPEGQSQPRRQA